MLKTSLLKYQVVAAFPLPAPIENLSRAEPHGTE